MPKIYHTIPTNEEQDAWEQKELLPHMLKGIEEDLRRDTIENKKTLERIKQLRLEREEMKKHGKFVNGTYIPNSEVKPIKSKKVKPKKQEDSDSEYEPNEVKKITDSVLKDKLLKIKNETKEIKVFLKK